MIYTIETLLNLIVLGLMAVCWWEAIRMDFALKRWAWFLLDLIPPIAIARGAMMKFGLA